MADCLIAFGSNLGNRIESLHGAVAALEALPDINLIAVSKPLQTEPVGGPENQSAYVNAAIRVESERSPRSLLQNLLEIEQRMGRDRRSGRWGPRQIDLDLLLYDELQVEAPGLVVPHPSMSFRRFVLEPAAEIAGDMTHPPSGLSLVQLVERLNQRPNQILIVGVRHPDPLFERLSNRADKKNSTKKNFRIFSDHASNSTTKGHIDKSDWSLLALNDFSSWNRFHPSTKLVVVPKLATEDRSFGDAAEAASRVDPIELIESAKGFPGPTLQIPWDPDGDELFFDRAATEIHAAIEAMLPIDRSA